MVCKVFIMTEPPTGRPLRPAKPFLYCILVIFKWGLRERVSLQTAQAGWPEPRDRRPASPIAGRVWTRR